MPGKAVSLQDDTSEYHYLLSWIDDGSADRGLLANAMQAERITYRRVRKGREQLVDLKPYIIKLSITGDRIRLKFRQHEGRTARPDHLVSVVLGEERIAMIRFHKEAALLRSRPRVTFPDGDGQR